MPTTHVQATDTVTTMELTAEQMACVETSATRGDVEPQDRQRRLPDRRHRRARIRQGHPAARKAKAKVMTAALPVMTTAAVLHHPAAMKVIIVVAVVDVDHTVVAEVATHEWFQSIIGVSVSVAKPTHQINSI